MLYEIFRAVANMLTAVAEQLSNTAEKDAEAEIERAIAILDAQANVLRALRNLASRTPVR